MIPSGKRKVSFSSGVSLHILTTLQDRFLPQEEMTSNKLNGIFCRLFISFCFAWTSFCLIGLLFIFIFIFVKFMCVSCLVVVLLLFVF